MISKSRALFCWHRSSLNIQWVTTCCHCVEFTQPDAQSVLLLPKRKYNIHGLNTVIYFPNIERIGGGRLTTPPVLSLVSKIRGLWHEEIHPKIALKLVRSQDALLITPVKVSVHLCPVLCNIYCKNVGDLKQSFDSVCQIQNLWPPAYAPRSRDLCQLELFNCYASRRIKSTLLLKISMSKSDLFLFDKVILCIWVNATFNFAGNVLCRQ